MFNWKKLGEVDVDGGIMIVSDAENFPKYFDPPHLYTHEDPDDPNNAKLLRNTKYPEMETVDLGKYDQGNGFIDVLAHDTCFKIGKYSGYSVPWLGGDGTFDVWGRFVENKIVDILIYSFGTYNTLYEDDFEIEKTKECTIDIYSGRIGIDEPNKHDKNGFVQPVLNLECSNSRQQYDIFELSLKFKSFGTELLGTHIELEPDNKITKNEIKELMKEIVSNEEKQNA